MAGRLSFLLLGLGFFASSAQVILFREFLVLFAGHELCLGLLYASWFVGIALGAGLGGLLCLQSPVRGAAWSSLALGFSTAVVLAGLRTVRPWLGVEAGGLPGLSALALVAGLGLLPIGLLIGLAFPWACRAGLTPEAPSPTLLGRVYVLESAGAVIGGWTAGIGLIGSASPFEIGCLAALVLMLGLIGWWPRREVPANLLAALTAAGLLVWWILGGPGRMDAELAERRFTDLQTGWTRVAGSDTPYGHLDLAESNGLFALYANGKLWKTFPDPYLSAPRAALFACEHPNPKRVLLLGNSSFDLLPFLLRHPIEWLDWVEMQPFALQLVRARLPDEYQLALADPRVHFQVADPRRALQRFSESYDLIISDAPDPLTAGDNRFFTQEFFAACHARMRPGGVFATRLSSSTNQLDPDTRAMVGSVVASLRGVFKQVIVLPGGETSLFGSDSPQALLTDPEDLRQRCAESRPRDPDFSAERLLSLFTRESVDDLSAQLALSPAVRANHDSAPISYWMALARWSRQEGNAVAWLLGWLQNISPSILWGLGLFLVLLAGLPGWLQRSPAARQRSRATWAIGMVGFGGLSLEWILMLCYQAQVGSIYRELGLLLAAFMGGLVGGGWLANLWTARRAPRPINLAIGLGCAALLAGMVPFLTEPTRLGALALPWVQVLLLGITAVTGAGTGVLFAMVSAWLALDPRGPVSAAARLDAADHLGAAMGALATTLVGVPLLGMSASCWWLASAFLLVAVSLGSERKAK